MAQNTGPVAVLSRKRIVANRKGSCCGGVDRVLSGNLRKTQEEGNKKTVRGGHCQPRTVMYGMWPMRALLGKQQ
jgi:hypothetical protein